MKRVLVTGGCGFIGSHLVERLVRLGMQVMVVDCLQINYGFLKNIGDLLGEVKFKRLDLSEFSSAVEAVRGNDTIFHLAAISHLPICEANPLQAIEVNYMATTNVLEACRVGGVEKVVYAGTDHIYGITAELPIREDSPMEPTKTYAFTKAQAIRLCRLYSSNYGLDVRILASGNVFGERQDSSKAVPTFIKQALASQPLSVNGGRQSRDFYYVGNLVNAYLLVADKGENGEVYNVGGMEEITVEELANRVISACGSSSKIIRVGYRDDEAENLRLILDKGKIQGIGYREEIGFEEGMARTVEWYKKLYNMVKV